MLEDLERSRRAAFIQGESREALGVRVLVGLSAVAAQLKRMVRALLSDVASFDPFTARGSVIQFKEEK